MALQSAPLSDRAIERLTGVPHQTVGRWRRTYCRRHERRRIADESWRPSSPRAYAYLLGLYLGDGHLVCRPPDSTHLRIALDERYTRVIDEAADAMRVVIPDSPVRRYTFGRARRVILQASHPVLPFVFPQHGPGRKHERAIRLEPWQAEVCASHTRAFLRGLIHSDGCRTTNRVRVRNRLGRTVVYEYIRYFFSNESADIRDLFSSYCALLGVRCTRSNARNVSVSDRASVAVLDSFVGPKS
jgi:hypothetical protein